MKKFILPIISFIIMISSCSNENKTLVAYFSATGTTKAVAEKIADKAGADLFEIKPAALYTEEDLNWRNKESRSSVEMIDPASRPEIAGKPAKLEKYETIYIGFPIWWYTAPRIINTFIEENDLAGKSVAFFATSGGSDIRKACNEFAEAYPEIKWLGGKLLNEPTDDDIATFLSGEDLKQNAQLAGGYSEQREPSEEEIELFKKVTGEGDMVLTPLSVATQVVAGLNYRFYCRYEEQGADSGHCYVIIYKPLQGDPTLTKIEKL